MAREHSESGFLAGLALADLVHASVPTGLVAALLTAGAALLPDLDHPSATAARTFGPVTKGLAQGVNDFGLWTWKHTATRYDRRPRDGHRTVTHTTPFALALGGLFGTIGVFGAWAMLAILFILASLAVRGLAARGSHEIHVNRKRRKRFHPNALNVSALGTALAGLAYLLAPPDNAVLVGACVALGCWVHCLGDSLTLDGCPWLWPLKIKGRRWYPIGTPRAMRFRTGTDEFDGEDRVRITMHCLIPLALIGLYPGAYAWIGHTVAALIP